MARVTVEDCIVQVPNRFELVLLAAQRARNIGRGEEMTLERDNDKNPVVALREIAEETLTAYALYKPAPSHALDSVIILNLEPYNSTANYTRPSINVTLPERIQSAGIVRRLTASGSDVKDFAQTDITFAGRSVNKEGLVEGEEVTETWAPGESVLVGDAEAVLITF